MVLPKEWKFVLVARKRLPKFDVDLKTTQKSMDWGELVGNEFPKRILERYLLTQKIPHCIVFAGKEGLGKMTMAIKWSRVVLCNQKSDQLISCGQCLTCRNQNLENDKKLFLIREESKILIDQVRAIKNDLGKSDFDGGYRVIVIDNAERMTNEAVNAFLKIMEEPGKNIIFLLLTTNLKRLKDTVKSRSAVIHFDRLDRTETDILIDNQQSNWNHDELYRLSMGRPKILNKIIQTNKDVSIINVEKFWRLIYGDISKKAILTKQIEKMNVDRLRAMLLFWESCVRDLQLYKIGSKQFCWWQDENLFKLYEKIHIDTGQIDRFSFEIAKVRELMRTSVSKKMQIFNLLISFNL
jgi:hypothetical protein